MAGLEAAELDQVEGQVVNPNGFAHVKHVEFPPAAHVAGFQHQTDGFRNGHKEPRDFLVGDGDGASLRNLFLEEGNNAAVAAQHVAKTRGHKTCNVLGVAVFGLDHVFGHPFGGAHHVGGVHGFVGRDHHKGLAAVFPRQTRHHSRSQAVGLDGFHGMVFHQGHVLVRGGVEHHLGVVGAKEGGHAGFVGHAADDGQEVPGAVVYFQVQLVEGGFGLVQRNQAQGVLAQDLAHQLGPDGAGGAGDQHGFALDEAGEAVVAEVDGLPAEEVFHADVADLGGGKLPVHPLPNGGHALHFQPNGQGLLGEGLDASSANAFGCQHHALHVVALHKIVGKRKVGLQNGQAVDGFADFVGVVVDVGHGKALQADVGVNGGLGTSAHAARSKDQNAQPFAGFGAGDEVLEQAANEQPQTYAER